MIAHMPDSVDRVQFEYEGARHVVVPGFMTSADLLRNMLLKSNGAPIFDPCQALVGNVAGAQQKEVQAPVIVQRHVSDGMSLKEKLLMQQRQQPHRLGLR